MTDQDLDLAEMIGTNSRDIPDTVQRLVDEVRDLREQTDPMAALGKFYDSVHADNVKAGWWTDISTGQPKKRNVGEMFVLIVTELAEAFDAYTKNEMDDKLPEFPGIGVELGDVQIRIADFCGALRAGRVVRHSRGTFNPGEDYFLKIKGLAADYEAIRKTPAAVGEAEEGEYIPAMDVVEMIVSKLRFNAHRADHKIENRLLDGGKRT